MSEPTLNYVPCADANGPRRMAYWQWGAADAAHTVVCVHGLSRQGRDFDVLAQALVARSSQRIRVVCPDVAGRGQSDWIKDPAGYGVPVYAADMLGLLAHLKPATLDWVGTSMGGLIGLAVTAHAASVGVQVRKLVLNDVGPVIQWEALQRIGSYVGTNPSFDTEQQAIDYLATISTGFGPHTPEQWASLSRPMLRQRDGRWWLHYDPAIAVPFRQMATDDQAARQSAQAGEAMLWALFDAITCPTLLLRGADSDLLSAATAEAMSRRGPRPSVVTWPGVGHAPTLVAEYQVAAIRDFLLAA